MAVPFDQRPDLIWMDGKLLPTSETQISVLTHGLHYASCVFEGERAYGGVIYKGTEHSERLKRSANILDFEIPFSVAEIDAANRAAYDRGGFRDLPLSKADLEALIPVVDGRMPLIERHRLGRLVAECRARVGWKTAKPFPRVTSRPARDRPRSREPPRGRLGCDVAAGAHRGAATGRAGRPPVRGPPPLGSAHAPRPRMPPRSRRTW